MQTHEFIRSFVEQFNIERLETYHWEGENGDDLWFNVSFAKEAIKLVLSKCGKFPFATLTAEDVKFALEHNYLASELNPEAVEKADCNNPLIAVEMFNPKTLRDEALIIDGWHRLKKAGQLGIGMKCYIFTSKEAQMLRMPAPDPSFKL
jgi:hypothetical protein